MSRGKRVLAPYFLILPGGVWLLLFFVVPMVTMLSLSLQQGDVVSGYVFTGHWQTYVDAIVDYKAQLIRSLIYGAIATILLIVVAFPVAYWIAFYAGRRKATFLFLLLLPFLGWRTPSFTWSVSLSIVLLGIMVDRIAKATADRPSVRYSVTVPIDKRQWWRPVGR